MTSAPIVLADLLPGTVAEMAARAGRPDFDRWAAQAKGCGHCARPIRLKGSTRTHTPDGRLVDCYTTAAEPDGVAYLRCGNRRAAVCETCSHEYQGDMWHLLYAGVAGGIKGVPETVAEHPMVFATLTAPSFGAVHTTRGAGRVCHYRRRTGTCPHGRPTGCTIVHAEDDPQLGTPLCVDCYDYHGHVAFNWYAPELWRRFTIALRRRIAAALGVPRSQLNKHVAVSFAKVAEFQRRGIVHFHALIRLDGPGDPYAPPTVELDAVQLGRLIIDAAAAVRVTTDPYTWGGPSWDLEFGEQCDVRPVHGRANRDASSGPMHPEMVAAYIAKYATKAADDFGLHHRRLPDGASLEALNLSDHTKRLLKTAIGITGQASAVITALEDYADSVGLDDTDNAQVIADAKSWLPLLKWLHMLGFRGHFSTKSRGYSTTMGFLRGERRAWRQAHTPDRPPIDPDIGADELEDSTLVVVRGWTFDGAGWLSSGDAALAASAAARARARREAAQLADGPVDLDVG
ncbi:replication initiator [Microlunatus ginsengisoli]|uniref:Replication initiator protein RepSA n=1 Tax=Microlunatus ginsengisoli TaxID=363863 RepID=A0ABP7AFB5_9ACTN